MEQPGGNLDLRKAIPSHFPPGIRIMNASRLGAGSATRGVPLSGAGVACRKRFPVTIERESEAIR
jgi:hypothetical protein